MDSVGLGSVRIGFGSVRFVQDSFPSTGAGFRIAELPGKGGGGRGGGTRIMPWWQS